MNFKNYYLLIAGILLLTIAGCVHEPVFNDNIKNDNDSTVNKDTLVEERSCDPDTVYFVNEILPLLQSSCAKSGCHDAQSAQKDVILNNYENIINTGDVRGGNPKGSDLYEVLTESGDDQMPPISSGGPLEPDQISSIKKWIEQGALNNECTDDACDTLSISFIKNVQPIIASNCQGCHNATNASAGINLEGYTAIKKSIETNRVMPAIRHAPYYSPMPKGLDKMNKCNIRTIAIWIENAMPNN